MKKIYDNQEDLMRQKFFTEKSLIIQQSAQLIKTFEIKANSAKFHEEELRKLRKQLEERINENDEREKSFEEERRVW